MEYCLACSAGQHEECLGTLGDATSCSCPCNWTRNDETAIAREELGLPGSEYPYDYE